MVRKAAAEAYTPLEDRLRLPGLHESAQLPRILRRSLSAAAARQGPNAVEPAEGLVQGEQRLYLHMGPGASPTPTNEGTSQNIQRSWLRSWVALFPEEEVHHRNRQRDDNRPENLELWARGRQPPGARVSDLVEEAVRILRLYAPEKLSEPI